MNNRQARNFAIAGTGIATLVFLILTVDSHRQFPELTQSQNITPAVSAGQDVWHDYNCINCHTLFGEGAYYAPDLTKITQHRGEEYLKAFMRDPSKFYDEKRHRRLMPNQNLSEQEISDLIAFLDWVSNVDNQGWPPRPIMVAGDFQASATDGSGPGMRTGAPGPKPVDAEDDPRAKGESLFRSVSPACNSCHSTTEGVTMAGPSLAGIATKAQSMVDSPDYEGEATTAEEYIRESIVAPSADLVPGDMYSSGGTSFMPTSYADNLSEEEIDQLTAYLGTLK